MCRRSRRIAHAPRGEQCTRARTGASAAARRYLGYIARNSRTQRRAERERSTRIRAMERAPHRQHALLCSALESTPTPPASATHARTRSLACARCPFAAPVLAPIALSATPAFWTTHVDRSSLLRVTSTRPAGGKTRTNAAKTKMDPSAANAHGNRPPSGGAGPSQPPPPSGLTGDPPHGGDEATTTPAKAPAPAPAPAPAGNDAQCISKPVLPDLP